MNSEELSLQTMNVEEADLDALLSGLPSSTPNADTLKHVKVEPEETLFTNDNDGPNLDELLAGLETPEDPKKEDEDEVEEEKEKKEKVEPKEEAPKAEKKTKESKTEEKELDESALKQITDFYIQSGEWKDFEGRDEFEFTAEAFQDLIVEQNKLKAEEEFNKILGSVGTVGKTIIEHIQKGGKPDDILDLFKEQKAVAEYEPNSPDEKKAFIANYYKDVHGFSAEKIKRIVTAAEADGSLDDELGEIKNSYEKYYAKEFQRLEEETAIEVDRQKKLEEKFQNDITSEIVNRKDLSERDKKLLKETILNYDHALPDGTKVSKFYVKFAEMQEDPKKYIDFVQFVLDQEKYIERIKKQEETKATEKVFLKIKRNQAVDNKSGSSHVSVAANKEIGEFKWY
jgi:hypothetical protein